VVLVGGALINLSMGPFHPFHEERSMTAGARTDGGGGLLLPFADGTAPTPNRRRGADEGPLGGRAGSVLRFSATSRRPDWFTGPGIKVGPAESRAHRGRRRRGRRNPSRGARRNSGIATEVFSSRPDPSRPRSTGWPRFQVDSPPNVASPVAPRADGPPAFLRNNRQSPP